MPHGSMPTYVAHGNISGRSKILLRQSCTSQPLQATIMIDAPCCAAAGGSLPFCPAGIPCLHTYGRLVQVATRRTVALWHCWRRGLWHWCADGLLSIALMAR